MNLPELPESIVKEFTVMPNGDGFISRRGIARLCGVDESSVRKLLGSIEGAGQNQAKTAETITGQEFKVRTNFPYMLQPFVGQSVDSNAPIDDILASAIIKYYAFQGKQKAQQADMVIGGIGLRTVIQKTLGWESPRKLTDREIVEIMCLPVPTDWQGFQGLKMDGQKNNPSWGGAGELWDSRCVIND